MASTYSDLKIELIGTGEQVGQDAEDHQALRDQAKSLADGWIERA
jgi:hypothetical protein